MTEKQKWRPPVAPKPSVAMLQEAGSNSRNSAALLGANVAFVPHQKSANKHDASLAGALSAATAADRLRPRKGSETSTAANSRTPSPNRGRSTLRPDLQQIAVALSRSPTNQGLTALRPPLHRSASTAAARAASSHAQLIRDLDNSSERGTQLNRQDHGMTREENTQSFDLIKKSPPIDNGQFPSPQKGIRGSRGHRTTSSLDLGQIPVLKPRSSASGLLSHRHEAETQLSAARTATAGNPRDNSKRGRTDSSLSTGPTPSPSPSPNLMSLLAAGHVSNLPSPTIESLSPPAIPTEDSISISSVSSRNENGSRPIPIASARQSRPATKSKPPAIRSSPRDMKSGMTVSSLADAMVASSLASSIASSRNPSPSRLKPPPPPSRRRSRSLTLDGHMDNNNGTSKLSPLPKRPMKHTLRKQSPEQEPSDYDKPKRGRRHWLRKHPNMHHEGDRKRWRDKITERERKRYEGVWAANRGMLVNMEQDAELVHKGRELDDLVLNIVVRELWERSRLPHDVLEEVWDLVAQEDSKSLNREEFVVGLWLIDQRLKGRKMPVRVSPSVWSSVRHIQGVKVRQKPL